MEGRPLSTGYVELRVEEKTVKRGSFGVRRERNIKSAGTLSNRDFIACLSFRGNI
jgi:hypothetical protein